MLKKTVLSEDELVRKLKAGDQRVVNFWFQQYHPLLDSYLKRRVDNALDREEIAQEVFINCLQSLARFNGKSSLKTWMFAIANHEVADYYRRRYAKKVIQSLPLLDHLLAEELVVYDSHDVAVKIKNVLEKLGGRTQELLLLKYIDKKPVKEIAQLVGRSPKSVESELFRARRDFRRIYDQEKD